MELQIAIMLNALGKDSLQKDEIELVINEN